MHPFPSSRASIILSKLFLLILLWLPAKNLTAQDQVFEKPDYKKIKKVIAKKNSPFYYPVLLEKFNAADTSISIEELRHLYYGFIYDKNYSPYGTVSEYTDSLEILQSKSNPDFDDLRKIIAYGDSILAKNPFDLRAIDGQMYAFEKLQEPEELNDKIIQLQMIITCIMSSGTGMSEDTPFYVISVSHEYLILAAFNLSIKSQSLLKGNIDYLKVQKNPDKIKGLYFDVSAAMNYLSNIFE